MWDVILILLGVAVLLPTAYAGVIGAPYAPTWAKVTQKAFDAIQLGKEDTLIDLGAGDGRIVIEAARRGAKAIGYELSPIMWAVAKLRVLLQRPHPFRGGLASPSQGEAPLLTKEKSATKPGEVSIFFGNFYKQDISHATVIFTFLMPKIMPRLKTWLAEQPLPGGKYLLTYAFPLPATEPQHVVSVPNEGKIYIYDLQKLTKQL